MKNNGGTAFPFIISCNDFCEGMSIRDYFAARAMQALIPLKDKDDDFKLAKMSYEIADAMLKERENYE